MQLLLTTNDISSFVIEGDSFTILKNFKFNHYVTFAQDFAEVKQIGKINLYIYYSLMGGPAVTQNGLGSTSQSTVRAVIGSYAMVNWVVEKKWQTR